MQSDPNAIPPQAEDGVSSPPSAEKDPAAVPAAPPAAFGRRQALAAAALFCASLALCTLGYLAITVPYKWFSNVATLKWSGADLTASRGARSERSGEALTISVPDPGGNAVVTIKTSFRSTDYPVVAWDISGAPDGAELGLLWRNDYAPTRTFTRPLAIEGGRALPTEVGGDPNWIGNITGLALVIHGGFERPITIRAATAKPMTAWQIVRDRLTEWLAFEHWNGASINSRVGGGEAQDLPLPFFMAAVTGFAILLYALAARWRHDSADSRFGVAAIVFAIGWFLLDAHWQWNLLRQVGVTREQYAGKSWREKHIAAEDGELFQFIEDVRDKLPPPPARVFMLADMHYLRDRGAYHLYPYNVYAEPLQNTVPAPGSLRTGDLVVVYQRKGVQFDPAQQRLRWDGGDPIAVDLVLVEKGGALFRVR